MDKRSIAGKIVTAVLLIGVLIAVLRVVTGDLVLLPERGDWIYPVGSYFEIVRINGRTIEIHKVAEPKSPEVVFGPYISEISCEGEYLFAKEVEVPEDLDEPIDRTAVRKYYIFNVANGKIIGSFEDVSAFTEQVKELGYSDRDLAWIDTTSLKDAVPFEEGLK